MPLRQIFRQRIIFIKKLRKSKITKVKTKKITVKRRRTGLTKTNFAGA